MPIGYNDLKNVIRFPATWDLTYLRQWALKDGTTFDQVVSRVGAALVMFNRELTSGYYSDLIQLTSNPALMYDTGSEAAELVKLTEYTKPDPILGDLTGHMLPLNDYGGSLGWTYMALRRANNLDVDRDVRRLIERARNTWNKRVLERLFTTTVETLGTSGKSVPFADGGTADSTYIPITYQGRSFLYTHNHFLRNTADAAGRTANLKAMVNHLYEHGALPPYDLIISEADVANWVAQAEFKKPERGIFSTANIEVRANVPEETYIGVVEVDRGWARVKAEPRVPTNYYGMVKLQSFKIGRAHV